jgi:hypothetical protein
MSLNLKFLNKMRNFIHPKKKTINILLKNGSMIRKPLVERLKKVIVLLKSKEIEK